MPYDSNSRMSRAIARYLKDLENQGLSGRYITQVKSTLRQFQEHCLERGIRSIRPIDGSTVLSYLGAYESASASCQRMKACVVRRFLSFEGSSAMLRLRVQVKGSARTRVDWLSEDEMKRVWETPMSPDQMLLIGCCLLNGLRRVEVLRITARDARNALRSSVLVVHGKSHKQREIPLQEDVETILRSYMVSKDLEDDKPILEMARTKSEQLLEEFCSRFGRRFTFHTMRRSCGRALWKLGVPLETISELFGHSSVDQTRYYLGLNLSDMREALARHRVYGERTVLSELAR